MGGDRQKAEDVPPPFTLFIHKKFLVEWINIYCDGMLYLRAFEQSIHSKQSRQKVENPFVRTCRRFCLWLLQAALACTLGTEKHRNEQGKRTYETRLLLVLLLLLFFTHIGTGTHTCAHTYKISFFHPFLTGFYIFYYTTPLIVRPTHTCTKTTFN